MLGHRSMIALKFRKMVHRFDGVTEEGDLAAALCVQWTMRYPVSTISQLGLLRIVLKSPYSITNPPLNDAACACGTCRLFT